MERLWHALATLLLLLDKDGSGLLVERALLHPYAVLLGVVLELAKPLRLEFLINALSVRAYT